MVLRSGIILWAFSVFYSQHLADVNEENNSEPTCGIKDGYNCIKIEVVKETLPNSEASPKENEKDCISYTISDSETIDGNNTPNSKLLSENPYPLDKKAFLSSSGKYYLKLSDITGFIDLLVGLKDKRASLEMGTPIYNSLLCTIDCTWSLSCIRPEGSSSPSLIELAKGEITYVDSERKKEFTYNIPTCLSLQYIETCSTVTITILKNKLDSYAARTYNIYNMCQKMIEELEVLEDNANYEFLEIKIGTISSNLSITTKNCHLKLKYNITNCSSGVSEDTKIEPTINNFISVKCKNILEEKFITFYYKETGDFFVHRINFTPKKLLMIVRRFVFQEEGDLTIYLAPVNFKFNEHTCVDYEIYYGDKITQEKHEIKNFFYSKIKIEELSSSFDIFINIPRLKFEAVFRIPNCVRFAVMAISADKSLIYILIVKVNDCMHGPLFYLSACSESLTSIHSTKNLYYIGESQVFVGKLDYSPVDNSCSLLIAIMSFHTNSLYYFKIPQDHEKSGFYVHYNKINDADGVHLSVELILKKGSSDSFTTHIQYAWGYGNLDYLEWIIEPAVSWSTGKFTFKISSCSEAVKNKNILTIIAENFHKTSFFSQVMVDLQKVVTMQSYLNKTLTLKLALNLLKTQQNSCWVILYGTEWNNGEIQEYSQPCPFNINDKIIFVDVREDSYYLSVYLDGIIYSNMNKIVVEGLIE